MQVVPRYEVVYRDNFQSISRSLVTKIMNREISIIEYNSIINYIEKKVIEDFLHIASKSVIERNSTILEEYIMDNNITNEQFKCAPTKRIFVELVQEDPSVIISDIQFAREVNSVVYKEHVDLFRYILSYLIEKYVLKWKEQHD